MMKNKTETLLDVMPKFFQVGFYDQKYYDIVLTNRRMILLWMGESYKPWMLRVDPGQNKRNELKEVPLKEMVGYHQNNISIDYKDVLDISLMKRNFLKNGKITIKTREEQYELYTKDKEIDYKRYYNILSEHIDETITLK